jgi:hypothetical protein
MLYFKLKAPLSKERQAMQAKQRFAPWHGVISPRQTRNADGAADTVYQVLIPAGRRPDMIRKQLTAAIPLVEYVLVDIDADGFEVPCVPDGVQAVRQ